MRLVISGCVALLSACASAKQVPLGQEFTLNLGESIGVAGKQVIVEFNKVIEDSRCPMNARCVWEGNAKVALGIREPSSAAASSTIELNTSARFATRQPVSDFSLELIRLEPTPMAGAQTTDYSVTLVGVSP